MSRAATNKSSHLHAIRGTDENLPSLRRMLEMLNVRYGLSDPDVSSLPFACGDVTAGSEAELQTVVTGERQQVDLPLTIEQSNYFADIIRRTRAGDTKKRVITDLENYLSANGEAVWENSWVRFPRSQLSPLTEEVFQRDLLADKEDPSQGNRPDLQKFLFRHDGRDYVRIPVSYLLKLSLVEAIGSSPTTPPVMIRETALDLMGHFLNDNTSPETFSFHVISATDRLGVGPPVAREMAKRFLLTQLLTMYANERFRLRESGQEAMVFYSPHPPLRQKRLNDCISDAFYRELFMSPCLSGWQRGEAKYDYMHLCHRVLSRSQLNATAKLRETGIITKNLVNLPNTSNISLANNGTHVSLGSRKLGEAMKEQNSGFTKIHEKYLGDLVVKITEHFLPLFVGTYTAAPYRLDFKDFHPEKALAFLPHELDYTHLRMLWRRWQKKAKLTIFGRPLTPFGPLWLDRTLSVLCGLRGDFIPDFRIIDYLVALMSTERSPALDGRLHNSDGLKKDLADLGVFDTKMSLYLFEKMREYEAMGFSGFEARHYSLFEQFAGDVGRAVDVHNLLYCLAYKYIANRRISHAHIPDRPFVESERRQIIFGTAIGIPTFFVRENTDNEMMKKIIARTEKVRHSRRYPGYLRVHNLEYRRALLKVLREDAADLIEMFQMEEAIQELAMRLEAPDRFAALGRLTGGILKEAGAASPLQMSAEDFNLAAERYYRQHLRRRHSEEALDFLTVDLAALGEGSGRAAQTTRQALRFVLKEEGASAFLARLGSNICAGRAPEEDLRKLIQLVLISVHEDRRHVCRPPASGYGKSFDVASIY
ncbi:MAG: hypothetical protein QG555_426 [Thermodesulfobacteriota bacterium]|nr:hypothetical protein [Thermodesulfobacteriota bacterium]